METQVRLQFEKFDSFIEEVSANVSLGGMFIRTTNPAPVGEMLSFALHLADDFKLIEGRGEVVWVRAVDEGPDRPAGMGIRFRELDTASRELIYKIVYHRMKEGQKPFDLAGGARKGIGGVPAGIVTPQAAPPAAAPPVAARAPVRTATPPSAVAGPVGAPARPSPAGAPVAPGVQPTAPRPPRPGQPADSLPPDARAGRAPGPSAGETRAAASGLPTEPTAIPGLRQPASPPPPAADAASPRTLSRPPGVATSAGSAPTPAPPLAAGAPASATPAARVAVKPAAAAGPGSARRQAGLPGVDPRHQAAIEGLSTAAAGPEVLPESPSGGRGRGATAITPQPLPAVATSTPPSAPTVGAGPARLPARPEAAAGPGSKPAGAAPPPLDEEVRFRGLRLTQDELPATGLPRARSQAAGAAAHSAVPAGTAVPPSPRPPDYSAPERELLAPLAPDLLDDRAPPDLGETVSAPTRSGAAPGSPARSSADYPDAPDMAAWRDVAWALVDHGTAEGTSEPAPGQASPLEDDSSGVDAPLTAPAEEWSAVSQPAAGVPAAAASWSTVEETPDHGWSALARAAAAPASVAPVAEPAAADAPEVASPFAEREPMPPRGIRSGATRSDATRSDATRSLWDEEEAPTSSWDALSAALPPPAPQPPGGSLLDRALAANAAGDQATLAIDTRALRQPTADAVANAGEQLSFGEAPQVLGAGERVPPAALSSGARVTAAMILSALEEEARKDAVTSEALATHPAPARSAVDADAQFATRYGVAAERPRPAAGGWAVVLVTIAVLVGVGYIFRDALSGLLGLDRPGVVTAAEELPVDAETGLPILPNVLSTDADRSGGGAPASSSEPAAAPDQPRSESPGGEAGTSDPSWPAATQPAPPAGPERGSGRPVTLAEPAPEPVREPAAGASTPSTALAPAVEPLPVSPAPAAARPGSTPAPSREQPAARPPVPAPAPAAPEPRAAAPAARFTAVETITSRSEPGRTVITIETNGSLPAKSFAHYRLDGGGQPRLLVKLYGVERPFRQAKVAVGTPEVLQVRTGNHPKELHVVIDLADGAKKLRAIEAAGSRLSITVE